MNDFILYGKQGYDTLPRVLDAMRKTPQLLRMRLEPNSARIIINYGCPQLESICGVLYNETAAVRRSSSKEKARMILEGAKIPTTFKIDYEPKTYPVIMRPSHHSCGKNLYVINNKDEFRRFKRRHEQRTPVFYTYAFYPKTKEYRVHVAHGKILGVSEKIPKNINDVIWNWSLGNSTFRILPWSEYPIQICLDSIKAVETLGLDFGAVDILAEPKVEKGIKLPPHVICEVNTAPRLEEYMASRYAMYFDWLLGKDTTRRHFKLPETITDPKQLVFGIY